MIENALQVPMNQVNIALKKIKNLFKSFLCTVPVSCAENAAWQVSDQIPTGIKEVKAYFSWLNWDIQFCVKC